MFDLKINPKVLTDTKPKLKINTTHKKNYRKID
jgi:hypothetical protein